jgi:hypothetical protein
MNKFRSIALGIALVALVTGCNFGSNQNPTIDGVIGPVVGYANGNFTMTATLENVSISGSVHVAIPNMPNSYVDFEPDMQSNGTIVYVDLSAADLLAMTNGGIIALPAQELPGGRPLPGVASGSLPAIALEVPTLDNMVVYIGPTIFGVFVPVKMDTQLTATFRFYDSNNKQVGNLSVVGEDANKANSGFLILVPIQGQVAKIIQSAGSLN